MTPRIAKDGSEIYNVCPYSFNRCNNPDFEECAIKAKAHQSKNTQDFIHATNRAKRCKHLGLELTRWQWEHRQLGVLLKPLGKQNHARIESRAK